MSRLARAIAKRRLAMWQRRLAKRLRVFRKTSPSDPRRTRRSQRVKVARLKIDQLKAWLRAHPTKGSRILAEARSHLGTSESPRGSNRGPKIDQWMRRVGYNQPGPWCAGYASCMVEDGGGTVPGGGSASCAVLRQRAQARGKWVPAGTRTPRRGWLAIVAGDHHVVIVDRPLPGGGIKHISGNTSNEDGSNYNGGTVAEHTYPAGVISGYIRTW